ncbi:MAG TPA: multicopper oxidase domain-containing protein [Nitrososphaeraceae archaeon]|nr:multicopper oxidase domain-containing protein [Nitrososphaeraceae archaeon]
MSTKMGLMLGVTISVIVVTLSLILYSRASSTEQNSTKIDSVGGHTPGYPMLQTTGDVLDPTSSTIDPKNIVIDPDKYLREFSYGRVTNSSNGTKIREFTLIASDTLTKEVSPGVLYNVWTFNGTIPGPTIRATEGDTVKITLINNGSKFHSIHTHGIHPSEMDGVFEGIAPGGKFTYEFTAEPFGVFPYHCHMQPLEEHITHGLYGVYIVDPKEGRPPADEMVMVMNGYDTDFDTENNFYTVNGIPYYYMHHPIQIDKNRLIRIYLVNMLEFDPLNNFHLHANMFDFYRTGTKLVPDEYTDIVSMNQAERGILEFSYKFPGLYMFHAHKTEFAEKGWTGLFLVKDEPAQVNSQDSNLTAATAATTNATDQIVYSTSNLSNITSILPSGGLK